jgi:hypothetical protein
MIGRAAGRRPTASPVQRATASGFLVAGVGLFVIPHNAGPAELLRLASESNLRVALGLIMIFAGLVTAVTGSFALGAGRRG